MAPKRSIFDDSESDHEPLPSQQELHHTFRLRPKKTLKLSKKPARGTATFPEAENGDIWAVPEDGNWAIGPQIHGRNQPPPPPMQQIQTAQASSQAALAPASQSQVPTGHRSNFGSRSFTPVQPVATSGHLYNPSWQNASVKVQRALHHAANIEERGMGQVRAVACKYCSNNEGYVCMEYTDADRFVMEQGIGKAPVGCSRCIVKMKKCEDQ